MGGWLRRLKGAIGMGVIWAASGFAAGGVIELIHNIWPNPIGAAVDIWPMMLAIPGFLGGLGFSVVLAIAGRHRRFDELSLGRFAVLGAAGGIVASLVPAVLVTAGSEAPIWSVVLELASPFAIGGAAAAAGTLVVARLSEDQDLLTSGEEIASVGLTAEEARELLGDR
jgi:hypothetical protein